MTSDPLGGIDIGARNGGEMALRMLLFRHYDRISDKLVNDGSGPWIHHAAKWAQNLVSHQLQDDPDYETELQGIAERFSEDKCPKELAPRDWGYLRRLNEMEAITRHINLHGAFKAHRTPMDEEVI